MFLFLIDKHLFENVALLRCCLSGKGLQAMKTCSFSYLSIENIKEKHYLCLAKLLRLLWECR